jgi:hypothetical protein
MLTAGFEVFTRITAAVTRVVKSPRSRRTFCTILISSGYLLRVEQSFHQDVQPPPLWPFFGLFVWLCDRSRSGR